MKHGKWNHAVLCIVILCLLLIPVLQLSAQVKKMSIQELTEESTAVLVGKCSSKQSGWNSKGNQIYTQVTIQASQYVKGDLGSEAVITIPGGQVDDILYEVSDMPLFEEGEESLVFVWQHPSGKLLITGAHHGKLRIVKNKKTGARTIQGGVLEFNPDVRKELDPGRQTGTDPVKLDSFIRTVKTFVKDE